MLVKQQQGLRGSTTWDPQGYQQFSRLRERPVIELLDHLPLQAPASIYDLGCGTGIATRLLAERWPEAQLFGVDSSAEMLAEARALPVNAQWLNSDIGQWEPKQPASLLFAAAVLHFMEDHENLLPRLLGNLHAGGYLALHMPNWRDAPWYHLMLRALSECGPAGRVIGTLELRKFMSARNVLSLDCYYRLLAPLTSKLDIWETEHLQVVEGQSPVFDWVKVSALRPVLSSLDDEDRDAFLRKYLRLLEAHYPREDDGRTLFPFKRTFIVASV
ncbi:methyltransferase domain-containing protein [Pseudomonas qingdaonensis]|uniref:Methyltransferase domain-containing protein n=2 Tax=Pseudomonas qingdaonensis TaxID=2056231 RepID=A0ABX8DYS4_9PSED|nr:MULTISPECIES: methyltransferase domain-containing protein [Pseudomonas]MCQ0166172.1 trans-aconitate methyltransferase [Pseudomonas sp. S12(2018)]QVL20395.1 methyltransferase domain-containing protein [Pseudomonas qingdaonensis]